MARLQYDSQAADEQQAAGESYSGDAAAGREPAELMREQQRQHDPKYQLLLNGDDKHDGLQRRDGLVYSRSGAVYVPNDRRLKTRLLELAHDAVGHFGRDEDDGATEPTLRVDGHDEGGRGLLPQLCSVCSQQELATQLPAGLLKPHADTRASVGQCGSGLHRAAASDSEGNNSIMAVVDRFSKMAEAAGVQHDHHRHPGRAAAAGRDAGPRPLPTSIVSDRDVRFTGAAWGQLWRGLKTEQKMSTAYHPQTDGQTERSQPHDADGAALVRGEARRLGRVAAVRGGCVQQHGAGVDEAARRSR